MAKRPGSKSRLCALRAFPPELYYRVAGIANHHYSRLKPNFLPPTNKPKKKRNEESFYFGEISWFLCPRGSRGLSWIPEWHRYYLAYNGLAECSFYLREHTWSVFRVLTPLNEISSRRPVYIIWINPRDSSLNGRVKFAQCIGWDSCWYPPLLPSMQASTAVSNLGWCISNGVHDLPISLSLYIIFSFSVDASVILNFSFPQLPTFLHPSWTWFDCLHLACHAEILLAALVVVLRLTPLTPPWCASLYLGALFITALLIFVIVQNPRSSFTAQFAWETCSLRIDPFLRPHFTRFCPGPAVAAHLIRWIDDFFVLTTSTDWRETYLRVRLKWKVEIMVRVPYRELPINLYMNWLRRY